MVGHELESFRILSAKPQVLVQEPDALLEAIHAALKAAQNQCHYLKCEAAITSLRLDVPATTLVSSHRGGISGDSAVQQQRLCHVVAL